VNVYCRSMYLYKDINRFLFRRNILKSDRSLYKKVLNKLNSKVLCLGVFIIVDDVTNCRLCIHFESE
jgi:hypothetical protein